MKIWWGGAPGPISVSTPVLGAGQEVRGAPRAHIRQFYSLVPEINFKNNYNSMLQIDLKRPRDGGSQIKGSEEQLEIGAI